MEQTIDFNVNHVITLFDYDKETEIFSLEIDFNENIDNINLSNELLKIGTECNILPLNITLYKIIKINSNNYYLDFN